MRTRLGIVGLLVATAMTAAVIWATSAAGDQTVHVSMPFEHLTTKALDFGAEGMGLGDRFAFRGALLNRMQTHRVGTVHGECVVQIPLARNPGLFRCSYLLSLRDGQITLEGRDPAGPGDSAFAVTGGTGSYRNARGEAIFTDTSSQTEMVIHLST